MLTFGSLFSGIGGFDAGFGRAGMRCLWQVEVADEPRRVLRRFWPEVNLYKDVRDVGAANLSAVDVICGGFPCQDLSVAGRRAGLDGERSGLWFEFHRIVAELAPRWVVIENVPGLLSSEGGRDFAVILRGLVECGYGVSWRVLDAQYDGVAQRRRRVFVVGSLGEGSSAQILFEREGVSWNPPARGETREGVAACIDGSPYADREAEHSRLIASSISASTGHHGHSSPRGDGSDNLIAGTMRSNGDAHSGFELDGGLVADTLNSGGNAGGFRTEPGAHLVACNNFGERDVDTSLSSRNERIDGDTETFVIQPAIALSNRGKDTGSVAETVRADCNGALPMVVALMEGAHGVTEMDVAGSLQSGGGKPGQGYQAIAFNWQAGATVGVSPSEEVSGSLIDNQTPAVAFTERVDNTLRADAGAAKHKADESKLIVITKPLTLQGFKAIIRHYANAKKARPGEVLCVLRQAVESQEDAERLARELATFRTQEVLQSSVHGGGLHRQIQAEPAPGRGTLQGTDARAKDSVRSLRNDGATTGRSSQGRKSAQQRSVKSGGDLPLLPHEGTQAEGELCGLWETAKGARLLQQAFVKVQEIWRSVDGQAGADASVITQKSGGNRGVVGAYGVRRLTPL